MVTSNEIKQVRQLHQKKYRVQQGRFIVEGLKPVEELLRSDIEICTLYVTADNSLPQGVSRSIEQKVVSSTHMERMSALRTPPGILAVAEIPNRKIPEQWSGWSIALDGINDPGNLGTILRTADWFGIQHVFASEDVVEEFNPKVVQASMGSVFRVAVHRVHLSEWLANQGEHGVEVVAADMKGEPLGQFSFASHGVLVMGSESHGLSEEIRHQATRLIAIPGRGEAESLNVAVATGIICSHLPAE